MPSTVHVDEDSLVMAWFRHAELFHLPSIWPPLAWSCGEDHEILQETFDDNDLEKKRIHSMGWQTFCKLAENAYYNLSIGYSHGRDHDNDELMGILTANMLRVGRLTEGHCRDPSNSLSASRSCWRMWRSCILEGLRFSRMDHGRWTWAMARTVSRRRRTWTP